MWFLDLLCDILAAAFIPSQRPAEISVSRAPAPSVITSLTDHPNVHEICGIIMQIDGLSEGDLQVLSRNWRSSSIAGEARDRALTLDTPLIIQLLATMSDVNKELLPADPVLSRFAHVDNVLVKAARNAIFDALAAEFAQPVIAEADYSALIAPWNILQGRARDVHVA